MYSKPILLVEDAAPTRHALRRLFEAAGYDVVCAANGREALLYLLEGGRPAVIVLDLNMPVMDGRRFRQLQRAEHDSDVAGIPVVLLSADRDLAEEANVLGAADYLAKPTEFQQLLQIIRSCASTFA